MSVEYEIERGVPFPGKQRPLTGRQPAYPFAKLQVGESFFVPSHAPSFTKDPKLCAAYHKARETMGRNFQWTREPGGFRIFRLDGDAIAKKYRTRETEGSAA